MILGQPEDLKIFFLERFPSPFHWNKVIKPQPGYGKIDPSLGYTPPLHYTYVTKGLENNFECIDAAMATHVLKSLKELRTRPKRPVRRLKDLHIDVSLPDGIKIPEVKIERKPKE